MNKHFMSVQFSACLTGFEIVNLNIEQSRIVSIMLLFDVMCEKRRTSLLAVDRLEMRSFSFYLR